MSNMIMDLRMFYALMDFSNDSICFKSYQNDGRGKFSGGEFVRVSKEKARHYGMTIPQIRGKTDWDLLPHNEAKRVVDDDLWVMKSKTPIRDKVERITRRSGEVVWVSVNKFPWVLEDDCVIGVISISRNITKRVLAEQRAKRISDSLMRIYRPLISIRFSIGEIFHKKSAFAKIFAQAFAEMDKIKNEINMK